MARRVRASSTRHARRATIRRPARPAAPTLGRRRTPRRARPRSAGWNGQPDGRARGSGGSPPRPDGPSGTPGRRSPGTRRRAPAVYGCAGEREHVVARAVLDDPAGVHDGEPAADRRERREVVRDEQHREPEIVVCRSRSSRSTWACTITSSAVVGSSAISSARVACERERDQHALALPAGELVRVVVGAARREPDDARAARRRGRHAPAPRRARGVQLDRLADLAADPLDRVERVQRALEDDRQLGPAHRAQAARASSSRTSSPSSSTSPVTAVPRGSSRRSAPASVDLPQPDSPARPSVSPAVEVEARRRGRPGTPPPPLR